MDISMMTGDMLREEVKRLRAELAECKRDNERLSEIGLITADALRLIGEGKPVPFQWMQKKLAALAADGNAPATPA